MNNIYQLQLKNGDIFQSIEDFLKSLIHEKIVDTLLIPLESPSNKYIIPALVKNEEEVKNVNIFTPYLLLNSAAILSQLTIDKPKNKIGVVLRSCEIRAAVELAKLKQINWDNLIIIGVDCLGTYEPRIYKQIISKFKDSRQLTKDFLSVLELAEPKVVEGNSLRSSCQGCEYPIADNYDIAVNFIGSNLSDKIFIQTSSRIEQEKWDKLKLSSANDISQWQKAKDALIEKRIKFKDKFIQDTLAEISDIKNFVRELENCRRCYNCRRACPICYCRECIFDTLIFEHSSDDYISRADKKGKIRMPQDTLLFHLTRMNHMVVSCVGCGQCSSACPNDIPIAKFFKTVGAKVQEVFNYVPGKNLEEEIPQSTFKEDEFPQVGK